MILIFQTQKSIGLISPKHISKTAISANNDENLVVIFNDWYVIPVITEFWQILRVAISEGRKLIIPEMEYLTEKWEKIIEDNPSVLSSTIFEIGKKYPISKYNKPCTYIFWNLKDSKSGEVQKILNDPEVWRKEYLVKLKVMDGNKEISCHSYIELINTVEKLKNDNMFFLASIYEGGYKSPKGYVKLELFNYDSKYNKMLKGTIEDIGEKIPKHIEMHWMRENEYHISLLIIDKKNSKEILLDYYKKQNGMLKLQFVTIGEETKCCLDSDEEEIFISEISQLLGIKSEA